MYSGETDENSRLFYHYTNHFCGRFTWCFEYEKPISPVCGCFRYMGTVPVGL